MFAILFKATAGLSMGIILTATTTNIEIIYELQKLRLPSIIIAIMSFSIRYIDVFIDEFKRVKIEGTYYAGKALLNKFDEIVRQCYYYRENTGHESVL